VKIRKATTADCLSLFPRLRKQDRVEIALSSGDESEAPLLRSLGVSAEAWVAVDELDVPICIYGVAQVGGFGSPWMVATPEVYRFSKRLVKDGRVWVSRVQADYPALFNFVHAENTASIAWLRSLGFTIGELVSDYGAARAPFYHFYRVRDV